MLHIHCLDSSWKVPWPRALSLVYWWSSRTEEFLTWGKPSTSTCWDNWGNAAAPAPGMLSGQLLPSLDIPASLNPPGTHQIFPLTKLYSLRFSSLMAVWSHWVLCCFIMPTDKKNNTSLFVILPCTHILFPRPTWQASLGEGLCFRPRNEKEEVFEVMIVKWVLYACGICR